MGDSFASGEGNPDVPVRFSPDRTADYGLSYAKAPLVGYPARLGDWREIGDRKFIEENARWHDQACHRSLYSHQLRAALQLAVEDPHRAVTYVGFACSGAETTWGLFLHYKGNEWVPNPPDLPQISAVAEAQCGGRGARDFDLPEAYHINEQIPELKGGLVLKKCDAEKARKIDLLMLSVGGNDIGFARLVANAVLADKSILRRLGGWFGQVHGFTEAGEQLETLDDRLKSVNRALHNLLHVPWAESDRVVLTGYPPMALLEDGKSTCPDGQAGMTVLPDFFLSEAKAREGNTAAERLYNIMREGAQQHSWTMVDSHRAVFRGRGLCAGFSDAPWTMADELRIPRKINGVWEPFAPSQWRAYAPRQRLFRTPNDAFMTGNFHVAQSLLQKVLSQQGYSWVQLLLASVYSGAFHPTAEGQAVMADAVVAKARGVLAKYESRRRARPANLGLAEPDAQ
jgi:lysophospholipase L1-like esterase